MAVTQTPTQYTASLDTRIRDTLPRVAAEVPRLRERLAAAGLEPGDLTSAAALDAIPVLTKDQLVQEQALRPPFGGFLHPDARVRRIFQSPGPIYEPEPHQPDNWRLATPLRAAGFGADDLVLNTFGYHLSPAGVMVEEACFLLGATVLPAGVGSIEMQAQACADVGITAIVGLPSYLKALLEKADAAGLRPEAWPLARAWCVGEPLPDDLRAHLQRWIPTVRQGFATADAGTIAYECESETGMHVPDDALIQICDLTTGAPTTDAEGQIVVTTFNQHYPMIRFGTGDLSAWIDEACDCGRPTPRIRGWLGRAGDAIKVRGMFLHPRQVHSVMERLDTVDAYRFLVSREHHLDQLRCEIVVAKGYPADTVAQTVGSLIRDALRFDTAVLVVDEIPDGSPAVEDTRQWT